MQGYTPVREGPSAKRIMFLIYIAASGTLLLLTGIDMFFLTWFKYCEFDFHLFYAKSNENLPDCKDSDLGKAYYYESGSSWTYSGLKSDFCDYAGCKQLMEQICPDFCDNRNKMSTGTTLMIIAGFITIISNGLLSSANFTVLRRGGINAPFLNFVLGFPAAAFTLGLILLAGVGGMDGYKSTNDETTLSFSFNPVDYKMSGGMVLAIILVMFQAGLAVFGFLFLRKAYQGPISLIS